MYKNKSRKALIFVRKIKINSNKKDLQEKTDGSKSI